MIVGAGHFLQESLDVDDADIVGSEGAQPRDAKVLISDHDGIGGSPVVAGEQPRRDEVHVSLER